MGTPPTPTWANLYMALGEGHFFPMFTTTLTIYKRFIDDVLGLWTVTDPSTNDATWEHFKRSINSEFYGHEWIDIPLETKVDFMDLTISIREDDIIATLYENPSNFHLYIPLHLCHPLVHLRCVVHGMINWIHFLYTEENDKRHHTSDFFRHLQRRGYPPTEICPLFEATIARARRLVNNPPMAPVSQ
jgi:hypothetical protein